MTAPIEVPTTRRWIVRHSRNDPTSLVATRMLLPTIGPTSLAATPRRLGCARDSWSSLRIDAALWERCVER